MVFEARVGTPQLQRERSGTDIALRANFERNAASGEKVHECRIIYGCEAVTNPFGTEELDGFSNLFRAADFSGVNEPVKTQSCGFVVNRTKLSRGNTQLIAADAEGDDGLRCALLCCVHHATGCFDAELTNGVENPVHTEPAAVEGLGGGQNGLEVVFRLLFA